MTIRGHCGKNQRQTAENECLNHADQHFKCITELNCSQTGKAQQEEQNQN